MATKITATVFLYYYYCCCCFTWSNALLHLRKTTAISTPYSYVSIHTLKSLNTGNASSRGTGTLLSSFRFSSYHNHVLAAIHHRHPSLPSLSTRSVHGVNDQSQTIENSSFLLYSAMGAAEFDPDADRKRRRKRQQRPFRDEVEFQLETKTKGQSTPIVESLAEANPVQPHNPTPKIIILGSTGQIGRHVIKNLMSIQQEIKIVAFVRDYEKACDVLYEELIRENGSRKGQPTLQLIVMDLVPESEIAGYNPKDVKKNGGNGRNSMEDDEDDDDEEYAVSAARFYNENVEDYDFRSKDDEEHDFIDPYQPLYDAMQNATAIISTVGSIRETIPFGDYILKPWRIFLRPDKWCKDPSHPYYVNYMVMKKVLDCAEKEQLKRDQQWKAWTEANTQDEELDNEEGEKEDNDDSTIPSSDFETEIETLLEKQTQKNKQGDRIRIIRISDLCVANPPWNFVTVFTNIIRSFVFRSQERCEKLLQKSKLVDTIVLRPGDLVDDVRNETTTALQVDIDGYLPSPSYVGREDVAQLATLAALSNLDPQQKKRQNNKQPKNATNDEKNETKNPSTIRQKRTSKINAQIRSGGKEAKHWNIAMGWTDSKNKYVTSAVTKSNRLIRSTSKHKSVKKAFQFIAVKERNRSKLEEKKDQLRNANLFYRTVIGPIRKRMTLFELQQTKPYGIFVLLPMLFFVYPMICSILLSIGKRIPILEKAVVKVLLFLKPLIHNFRSGGIKGLRESSPQLKKLIY